MTSNKRLLLVVLGIVFLLIIVQLYSLGTYSPGSGRHSSSSTSTFGQDSDLRDDHYRKEYGTPWAPSDATDYDRMYAAIDKQPRPKAAMVILTRNEELDELIRRSMLVVAVLI